jgi:hypothetical protein
VQVLCSHGGVVLLILLSCLQLLCRRSALVIMLPLLYTDVATAHAALILDMRQQGLINSAEATTLVSQTSLLIYSGRAAPCHIPVHRPAPTSFARSLSSHPSPASLSSRCCCHRGVVAQRRLLSLRDPSVRAAWKLYVSTQDLEDLEDTLVRIIRSEEHVDDDVFEAVSLVKELVQRGLLSEEDGGIVEAMARSKHEVRGRLHAGTYVNTYPSQSIV